MLRRNTCVGKGLSFPGTPGENYLGARGDTGARTLYLTTLGKRAIRAARSPSRPTIDSQKGPRRKPGLFSCRHRRHVTGNDSGRSMTAHLVPVLQRMIMFLKREHLQAAGIDPEKIVKFADLFPNGTEVTRDVCVKFPQVFSFELDGMRILPQESWTFYCEEIICAKREHISQTQILRIQNRSRAGAYNPNEDYPLPTWGRPIPVPPRRLLTKQEMDIFNEKLQAAANENKQSHSMKRGRA